MSNSDSIYEANQLSIIWGRTAKSKAALDIARALRRYRELVKSGVDSTTAFIMAFSGDYWVIPPGPPRPDYIATVSELYSAVKAAHSYFSQLKEEAEDELKFLETLLQENPD